VDEGAEVVEAEQSVPKCLVEVLSSSLPTTSPTTPLPPSVRLALSTKLR
jgi:hypothetical protein